MELREVYRAFDDSVDVHFDQVAFGDFLIICDKAFTEGATDFEDVAASEFFIMGIFVDFHKDTLHHRSVGIAGLPFLIVPFWGRRRIAVFHRLIEFNGINAITGFI